MQIALGLSLHIFDSLLNWTLKANCWGWGDTSLVAWVSCLSPALRMLLLLLLMLHPVPLNLLVININLSLMDFWSMLKFYFLRILNLLS